MIKKIKRIPPFLIKFVANLYGYKIGMVKVSNGETTMEGDKDILRYFDISGYVNKKEPINKI
jgi:hypothetical protein